MFGIDQLEKMQALHENGLRVSVVADVKDLIASHIEVNQMLRDARGEIARLEKDEENDDKRLSDEVVSLSYWLAKELGEHVDASDEETLTDTVQRLIQRQLSVIPCLPDVVYLAWPNPEKAQFERRSSPSANPALGVAVFTEELAALRFANDSDAHYRVTCAPFGMTINQARYDRNALLGDCDPDATEKKEPF